MTELNTTIQAEDVSSKSMTTQADTCTVFLPELGDDVTEGKVVTLLFSKGDLVSEGDIIAEVETDKVMMEIPADCSGTVVEWLVSSEEAVSPGTALAKLKATEASSENELKTSERRPELNLQLDSHSESINRVADENEGSVETPLSEHVPVKASSSLIAAGPSARRLAREIGVDLSQVTGSGPRGRIGKADVKAYSRQLHQQREGHESVRTLEAKPLPDLGAYGEIHREPVATIEQATATHMSQAWSQIPHAWLQEKIDITSLEAARQRYKERVESEGGSLTLTALIVKGLALTLKQFPRFNSALDTNTNELVYRDYCHIGVAVDTSVGLVVPKVEDANLKNLTEIACDLTAISKKAHERKLTAKDLSGSGVTLSNLGGIGLTGIFPIVNWPQVAILGVAASQMEPRLIDGEFKPKLMMPVTLGFDHRVINGADGARFLQHLKQLLEDPFSFLL